MAYFCWKPMLYVHKAGSFNFDSSAMKSFTVLYVLPAMC